MSKIKVTLRVFKTIYKHSPVSFIITSLASIVSGIMPAILASVTANIIAGLIAKNNDFIWKNLIFLIFAYLFDTILQSLYTVHLNAGVFENVNYKLRAELGIKKTRLSPILFENKEFLERLSSAHEAIVEEELVMVYFVFLRNLKSVFSLISLIILLLTYNKTLLFVSIASTIPILVTRLIRGRRFNQLRNFEIQEQRVQKAYKSWFLESPYNKELRVNNAYDFIKDKWIQIYERVISLKKEVYYKDFRNYELANLFRTLALVFSILFTIVEANKGNMSLSVVGASLIAFTNLQNAFTDFLSNLGGADYFIERSKNYFYIIDLEEKQNGTLDETITEINFNDTKFIYPKNEKPALYNLNLRLEKNKTYAIVGTNGSGKTTSAKILLGIYPATEGSIQYNHEDIERLDLEKLYNKIGYVPQNIPKLPLTLREFLSLGESEINEELMKESLDRYGLSKLNNCFDKILLKEFDGIELSGGQWQKLYMVKVDLKNPDLLILDEATSAIDPIAETDIYKKILNSTKNRLSYIITHRLALCKSVDYIYVFDAGQIVEEGSHAELMKKNGLYTKMYTIQSGQY